MEQVSDPMAMAVTIAPSGLGSSINSACPKKQNFDVKNSRQKDPHGAQEDQPLGKIWVDAASLQPPCSYHGHFSGRHPAGFVHWANAASIA
jgi:hypothetical protein